MPIRKFMVDEKTGVITEFLDADGNEVPDPTRPRMPAGFKRPETLAEQVRRLVRTSLSAYAEQEGHETFDDADDFDVDDDVDPATPYETFFDPVLGRDISPHEFKQREAEYRKRYVDATNSYFQEMDRMEAVQRGGKRRERVSPADDPERREPPVDNDPKGTVHSN